MKKQSWAIPPLILLHKALRDMFGEQLHQTGSNITSERVRFDFNFDRKLEDAEIAEIEKTVNGKISENLPVHFEIMPLQKAKEVGAIGLFDEKYGRRRQSVFCRRLFQRILRRTAR